MTRMSEPAITLSDPTAAPAWLLAPAVAALLAACSDQRPTATSA